MRKISQKMAKDKIVDILREEIVNGNLKPHQKLLEIELCEQLGVSRTPLREAIRMLEVEGLVESIPNRGSRVATFTLQDIENIYELRIMLESLAVEKSVAKLTEKEFQELEDIQNQLKDAFVQEDWIDVDRLNQAYHKKLFSACPNDRLVTTISQLNQMGRFMRISAFSIPGRTLNVIEEHEEIIKYARGKDAKIVGELMRKHLIKAKEALLQQILSKEGN